MNSTKPSPEWTSRFDRVLKITKWLQARHDRQSAKKRQLAFYYAKKSGVFAATEKPSGYWFHCLHNWTIGNGPAAGNAFAIKALATWRDQWEGQGDQMKRVYSLAYAKYLQSFNA